MNRRNMAAVLAMGVLVAGCGSGGDTTGEADDTAGQTEDGSQDADAGTEDEPDSSDAADESGADGDFCNQITELDDELAMDFDASDLTAVVEQYQKTHTKLEGVDVPDELSGAWGDVLEMFDLMIGLLDGVDTSDPAAVGEAWGAAEADISEAAVAAEAASNEIIAYTEETCGVTLGTGGSDEGASDAAGADPCEMLDAAALEIVFTSGAPEPELEDMGMGFAQCTWAEGETEVWLTVMPLPNMDDYLEAGGEELGDSSLGAGAVTYESSIGQGRVSSGGGTVAFASDDVGVIVAVRGDGIADPVATAIELAELIG